MDVTYEEIIQECQARIGELEVQLMAVKLALKKAERDHEDSDGAAEDPSDGRREDPKK